MQLNTLITECAIFLFLCTIVIILAKLALSFTYFAFEMSGKVLTFTVM